MAGADLHKVSDADLQNHAHRTHGLVAVEMTMPPLPSALSLLSRGSQIALISYYQSTLHTFW